uniref:L1 transposable element RRM domain-containing protein n=1 Tax=Poecilia formosa TaxID=48698 RepID=A0A087Y5X8_POEFO
MEGLNSITAEIRDFKKEVKENLTKFKEENDAEIQKQQEDMTEAQRRIAELEEWRTEAKDAILSLLKQQRKLQEKLKEVEGHGRRCNMRIYNVAEQDGELVQEMAEKLLHRELALPAGTELQIQRAHRSLGKKPPPEANPRSMVVNFLKYQTKEEILTKAWKNKGKRIFFDHDYPTEVIEKRKSYSETKKALKDRKIRFQMPMTKIRIHWSDGIKIYNNAEETVIDMRGRGLEME